VQLWVWLGHETQVFVGMGWVTATVGWVGSGGSRNLDPCPSLKLHVSHC